MPKRKTSPKKAAFAKNRVIYTIVGVVLLAALAAQMWFNLFMWDTAQKQAAFQMRSLLVDSIRGIDNMRRMPQDNRIPEARLLLPKENAEVGPIRYHYNDFYEDEPVTLNVSSNSLVTAGIGMINTNAENMERLFGNVVKSQACVTGFTIAFDEKYVGEQGDENTTGEYLAGTKQLADGRTMYLWRQNKCGSSDSDSSDFSSHQLMNDHEKYLLQIESY